MSRSFTGAQNALYAIPSYTVSAMSAVIARASIVAASSLRRKPKPSPGSKARHGLKQSFIRKATPKLFRYAHSARATAYT